MTASCDRHVRRATSRTYPEPSMAWHRWTCAMFTPNLWQTNTRMLFSPCDLRYQRALVLFKTAFCFAKRPRDYAKIHPRSKQKRGIQSATKCETLYSFPQLEQVEKGGEGGGFLFGHAGRKCSMVVRSHTSTARPLTLPSRLTE
jgi:hypothetical protein